MACFKAGPVLERRRWGCLLLVPFALMMMMNQETTVALSRVVSTCARTFWLQGSLKPFQEEAIRYLVDPREQSPRSLLLVSATGSGKSTVMRGAATILRGVTLNIMPLHSLAADQLAKVRGKEKLYAFHLDDIKTLDDVHAMEQ